MVGASPGSVTTWRQKRDRDGPDALAAKPHPGPAPRLDHDDVTVLLTLLVTLPATPAAAGTG